MQSFKTDTKIISDLLVTLTTLGLLVSGCASMGKNECLNAQWRSVGYEDGAKGYKAYRIGEHRKACAKYNISPDLEAYTKGRLQGLTEWCTPANGYRQGIRGAHYTGVCPQVLEAEFKVAMDQGIAVYDYRKKVQYHEKETARLHKELESIEKEIDIMEAALISDQVSPRQRRKLLDEIRAAEEDRKLVNYDISDAEITLDEMRHTLDSMKAQHNY